MNPDRFERVKEILLSVIDLPTAERQAALDRACVNDPDLRREVEDLLAHQGPDAEIPETPIPEEESAETTAAGRDAEPAFDLVGRAIGHYRVEALLGEGGMGLVYRAEDTALGRTVALKFMRVEAVGRGQSRARFLREARAAAALDHPNICTVHAIEEFEGNLFLAMAFVDGETLRERIHRGPLPQAEALELAIQVAQGLEAAHAKGIVHRDIKPTNIMISRDGRAQILDFGLARPSGETEVTRSGVILGTAAYMSPEQALGRGIDARTDIWSLGVVLFEMLTGVRPFGGDQMTNVLYAIVHEAPADVRDLRPELPAGLTAALTRALAKAKEDRYASAAELRRDLERIRIRPETTITSLRTVRRRSARRSRAAFTVAGLLLAAAAATTAGVLVTRYRTERARIPRIAPRQVTSATAWEGEPAISPDGSRIAYVTGETGRAAIAVVDARGGNPIFVTPPQDSASYYSPSWFPDGSRLVMISDRSGSFGVWQIGQYGGGATMILPHAYDPEVSPNGKRLAFARLTPAGAPRIFVATIDAPADSILLTHDDDGLWGHRHPAWSPDGTMICYESAEEMWIVPSGGGRARRLSSRGSVDLEPAWSPSARYVYFSSVREGTRAIWRVSSRGGDPVRLTLGTGPEVHPSLSRDGSRLAYSTERTRYTMYVRDRTTGAETHLTDVSNALMPSMAPDGRRIAFTSRRVGKHNDILVQPLRDGRAAGRPQLLTQQQGDCSHPTFSPDGEWIAYYVILEGQRDIWIMPATGGEPHRITEDPASDIQPAWSPDGRFLAFSSDRGGTQQIHVVPISEGRAAGPAVALATPGIPALAPSWSPDGREIAFVGGGGEERDVWIVPGDGSRPPRRISRGIVVQKVHWEPDQRRILASGGQGDIRLYAMRADGTGSEVLTPPVRFGVEITSGFFDISSDGRWLVYAHDEMEGDIWVIEARSGAL